MASPFAQGVAVGAVAAAGLSVLFSGWKSMPLIGWLLSGGRSTSTAEGGQDKSASRGLLVQQFPPPLERPLLYTLPRDQRLNQFCVMSYNILADGERYALSSMMNYCPLEYRQWSYRWPLIRQEIVRLEPDVLCLQECTAATYSQYIQPELSMMGFEGVQGVREKEKADRQTEALFFRTSKFSSEKTAIVRYDELAKLWPKAVGKKVHPSIIRRTAQFPDVAILALLRMRPSSSSSFSDEHRHHSSPWVLVAATHLHYHPANPDVKAYQAQLLCFAVCSFLKDCRLAPEDIPLIICGDFNSVQVRLYSDEYDTVPPTGQGMVSGVYQLLTTGTLPASHPHHPSTRATFVCRPYPPRRVYSAASPTTVTAGGASGDNDDERDINVASAPSSSSNPSVMRYVSDPIAISPDGFPIAVPTFNTDLPPLRSVYAAAAATGILEGKAREPIITHKTDQFMGCIDYIFVSQRVSVHSILAMPVQPNTTEAATLFPPMPNKLYPSDHFSLACIVSLLPKSQRKENQEKSDSKQGRKKGKGDAGGQQAMGHAPGRKNSDHGGGRNDADAPSFLSSNGEAAKVNKLKAVRDGGGIINSQSLNVLYANSPSSSSSSSSSVSSSSFLSVIKP